MVNETLELRGNERCKRNSNLLKTNNLLTETKKKFHFYNHSPFLRNSIRYEAISFPPINWKNKCHLGLCYCVTFSPSHTPADQLYYTYSFLFVSAIAFTALISIRRASCLTSSHSYLPFPCAS